MRIPARVVVVVVPAAVSGVPTTLQHVVPILAKVIPHQGCVEAIVILRVQALAIGTKIVPAVPEFAAAISPIPGAGCYIADIMTIPVTYKFRCRTEWMGIQALTILTVIIPARVDVAAAITPVPGAHPDICLIVANLIAHQSSVWTVTCQDCLPWLFIY